MPDRRFIGAIGALLIAATFASAAPPVGCGTPNTAGGQQINVSPTSFTFTVTQGASSSQALSISEIAGQSADDWTGTTTTASGGSWLSITPTSGTCSLSGCTGTSVNTNASGLAAGSYSGSVLITPRTICSGNITSGVTRTIPVSLTVNPPAPTISLSASSLGFTATQGGSNPSNQSVTVSNSGPSGSTLTWSVSASTTSGGSWLTASGSGSLASGASGTITASVTTASLAAGNYAGTITVTAAGATNSPQTISVNLTVNPPPPVIALSSSALSFSAQQNGANPANQTVTVSNAGGGTLLWVSAVSSGSPWLGASGSGTGSGAVTVSVNISGLAPGTYSGTVQISATEATNSPQNIAVTLTVTPAPMIALSTASLAFVAQAGGPNPPSQPVSVSNSGGGTLNWTASVAAGASWLTVAPADGSGAGTITMSVNITGLAVGTHNGTVQVAATGASNTPQNISVTLTITAEPTIGIAVNPPSVTLTPGGPAQTVTVTITRSNFSGAVTLGATNLPAGVTATLTDPGAGNTGSVTLQAAAGAAIVSNQTVSITATGSGVSASASLQVSVAAAPAIAITLNPGAATLTAGGAPASVTVSVIRTNFADGVTLSLSTLPSGVTATITQPGTGNSGAISLQASSGAAVLSGETIAVTAAGTGVSSAAATFTLTVNAQPAIALAVSPASVSLAPGGTQVVAVTVTRTNFTGAVTLAVAGLPTGVTTTIAQPDATSGGSVTLQVSSSAPLMSNQMVTVTGTGAGVAAASATINLSITAAPAISIGITPAAVSLTPGAPAQALAVTISRSNFTGVITLSVTGVPAGVTATLSDPGTGNSGSVTLEAAAGAPMASNQPVTITAGGTGVAAATATVQVSVAAAPALSISLSPGAVTLAAGGPTQAVAISVSRTNFSGTVTLAVNGLPAGVTAEITQPGTGNSASISLQAGASATAASNQVVTVTATGSGVSAAMATFAVTVTPAGTPVLALSTDSLHFAVNPGQNPEVQTFQVRNSGSGSLGWSATVAGSFVSISPTTGTALATITVVVNSSTLAVGVHTATITIAALPGSNAAGSPQTVQIIVAVGAPLAPPNAVVNGASFSTEAIVSSGSIASLFGVNLSAGIAQATTFPLPTTLGGTQVLVNNVASPLFFVSPGQINFQIPVDAPAGAVSLVVISGGVRGNTATMRVAAEEPGIFTMTSTGRGQGAVLNQDFTINGPQALAARLSVLQIYMTGLGRTNPPLTTGQPGANVPPFNETVLTPLVLIGNIPARVLISLAAPGFAGLYQINAEVPGNAPVGDAVELEVQVGGRRSNRVTIAIR